MLSFVFSLILLLLSAHFLVKSSKKLSIAWSLSPIFISLVVVALGTSLPELAVTVSSLMSGDGGLAIGNIVGSNITNATLVFGLSVVSGSLKIGTFKTQRNAYLMLIVTGLFVFLQFSRWSGIFQAGILYVSLVAILVYDSLLAFRGRFREDKASLLHLVKANGGKPSVWLWFPVLAVTVVVLFFSGQLLVQSVNDLALVTGISTSFLGLTLTATVTSLPEILTLLIAGIKGESKIALGTILGSNIYNLTLIGGLLSFFPTGLTPTALANDLMYLLFTTVFLVTVVLMLKGKVVRREVGFLGIFLFLIFLFLSYWTTA